MKRKGDSVRENKVKAINGVQCKLCRFCEKWLEVDAHFYKSKNNSDGFHSYCKKCIKEKSYKWKVGNREKIKEHHKKYNSTSKRKIVYKKFNDKEETKNKYSLWRRSNPEKLKKYNEKRSQNKSHKISKQEWIYCKEYFNNSCAYCGLSNNDHYSVWVGELKKMELHKEHVNHNGSNELDNCVPSCQSCNSSKWEYSLDEWYTEGNIMTKFSQERLEKIQKWLSEDYKLYINVKIHN